MSAPYRLEKHLERDAQRLWELAGYEVVKLSQPRAATGMTAGIPDAYVRHAKLGVRRWVEYKAGRNTVSPHQAAWHERERAAGGEVEVVRSLEDVQRIAAEDGINLELSGEILK